MWRIMEPTKRNSSNIQLIWGAALTLMGVAVFFRVPQVVSKLEDMGQSGFTITFFRICMYIIGIILVGGGVRKLIQHFKPEENTTGDSPSGHEDS